MLNNYIFSILNQSLPNWVSSIQQKSDYNLVTLRPLSISKLVNIFSFLKLSSLLRLTTLTEYTAYDTPSSLNRFTLNFFLLNVEYNFRLAVNISLNSKVFVPSLVKLYASSNWSERELRDMFGLYFTNNLDLRRLLTDYGFSGFPLRKDFPLTGYFEVRYDDELSQILYEPVQLSQEFRVFALSSPWEKK